ncbi:MAG: hypothetical protein M3362_01240 [Acidobacteriota bacterium]|nr:hypothetical protein [Acidobacteriota bacterium]
MEQGDKTNQTTSNEEPRTHRHSKVITAMKTLDDQLHWNYNTRNLHPHEDESIEVRFFVLMKDKLPPQQSEVVKTLLKELEGSNIPWLVPSRKTWAFNLDRLKSEFKELQKLDWCRGKVFVEPELIIKDEIKVFGRNTYYRAYIIFYINPEVLGMATTNTPPVEIQQSLNAFRLDHPDPKKVAFIMMQFGNTPAHDKIVQGIRDTLAPHGLVAVRADDKEYHSSLLPNIQTYLHGCDFGIAVFERIEQDDFNPNVSLEVGYMMAMGKDVCLLKDRTLRTLHTDLVGRLYRTFDPQDPITSIPIELTKWMKDKGKI